MSCRFELRFPSFVDLPGVTDQSPTLPAVCGSAVRSLQATIGSANYGQHERVDQLRRIGDSACAFRDLGRAATHFWAVRRLGEAAYRRQGEL